MNNMSLAVRLARSRGAYGFQYPSLSSPLTFGGLAPSEALTPQVSQPVQQQPSPPVQTQSPDALRQLFELGWGLFDQPSFAAFQVGGKLLGSPDAWVRAAGAFVCIGAIAYGADKLEKKLKD